MDKTEAVGMVAYLLSELSEIQRSIFPQYRETVGSTNFTMVPTRNISNWPPSLDFSKYKGVGRWTDAGIPLGPPTKHMGRKD